MSYSLYEVLYYLFVYSFMGWCIEVLVMAFRTGRFCNRGMLPLPLCLPYGVAMVILIIGIPTLRGEYVMQALLYIIVTEVCAGVSNNVSEMISGRKIWDYHRYSLLSNGWKRFAFVGSAASVAWVVVRLVHPIVFLGRQLIPFWILKILIWSVGIVVLAGAVLSVIAMHFYGPMIEFARLEEDKESFGRKLTNRFWNNLLRAYPNLEITDEETLEQEVEEKQIVFAEGLCLPKVWWVFLISAIAGDVIETFYCRLVGGTWMLRSSVLYGPFSVVWGVGAALLTVLLYRLRNSEDRYIFIAGFFIGGAYEYVASLVIEIVLGTRFWDYSNMPFNLHGRTNLLYCIFWGILGVVWVKICYPAMSRLVEKIPPIAGIISTWVLIVLMTFDLIISGLAIGRYVQRNTYPDLVRCDAVSEYLDENYPDPLIESAWENLVIQK